MCNESESLIHERSMENVIQDLTVYGAIIDANGNELFWPGTPLAEVVTQFKALGGTVAGLSMTSIGRFLGIQA